MDFKIEEISFETILPIWSGFLWPNRQSPIETVSAIGSDSLIDINIKRYADSAKFFALVIAKEIVGVVSTHLTADKQMRMRGLYVHEAYRKKGLASALIQSTFAYARSVNCDEIWCLIRIHSYELYEKNGYLKELTVDKFEFGPHYLVRKKLSGCP